MCIFIMVHLETLPLIFYGRDYDVHESSMLLSTKSRQIFVDEIGDSWGKSCIETCWISA